MTFGPAMRATSCYLRGVKVFVEFKDLWERKRENMSFHELEGDLPMRRAIWSEAIKRAQRDPELLEET